ncbi:MAG: hypothetical protein KF683_01340 [Rubrivivax sp.]|nr:hypothetical protein [Rubrivivax sp.]
MDNDAGGKSALERGVRCAAPKRADVDRLMKRCQIGVGGRHALDEAHSIMADCYGTLGALMLTVERYAAALEWIEGATAATPGLTEAQLGRVLATIGRKASGELSAPNVRANLTKGAAQE